MENIETSENGNSLTIQVAHESWNLSKEYEMTKTTSEKMNENSSSSEHVNLAMPTFGLPTVGGAPCGANPSLFHLFSHGYPSNTLDSNHPQHPKTITNGIASVVRTLLDPPKVLPLWVVLLGEICIATVPGEPTIMTSHKIEVRLLRLLSKNGISKVIVFGFTGEYCGYWVTEDEYDQQLYEGSSTLFGRQSSNILEERLVSLAEKAGGMRDVELAELGVVRGGIPASPKIRKKEGREVIVDK